MVFQKTEIRKVTKTTKYLIAIAGLLIINLYLFFSVPGSSQSSFDENVFLIGDTTSISQVSIENSDGNIKIEKNNGVWVLNETYQVDQNFLRILFTILNKVKVSREIGTWEGEISGNVAIQFADGTSSLFDFSSDAIGTKSYFITENTAYQVEVPGYRDNVVNIFELNADQWRNRVVFNGSWRTIQKLDLKHPDGNLSIQFNNQFFNIEGILPIDSTAVVNYLNQFQAFQANEMLSEGRFSDLDSHLASEPMAILEIEDIQVQGKTTFEIYSRLEGQSYHLVTKNGRERMVIDGRRVREILKTNQDFTVDR